MDKSRKGSGNYVQADDSVDPPVFRVVMNWDVVDNFPSYIEAHSRLYELCLERGKIKSIPNHMSWLT